MNKRDVEHIRFKVKKVNDSDHWIDNKHLEYWKECIDETIRQGDLKTVVVIIPGNIREHIK